MIFNVPEKPDGIVDRSQQDVKSELDASNPWLESGFIRAVSVMVGRRVFDLYRTVKRGVDTMLPTNNADFWGYIKNMTPVIASMSSGPVVFVGTVGASISIGDVVEFGGVEFETTEAGTVASVSVGLTSLTRTGETAYAVTSDSHGFGSGMTIVISGADESDWNGSYSSITVTGESAFTFDVPTTVPVSTTGTMLASADMVSVSVQASETGDDGNLQGGVQLSTQSPITGISETVYTTFDGIYGGTDDETEQEWIDRVVNRWRNPHTPMNPAAVEAAIKSVPGNTRAWVHRIWNHDNSDYEEGCFTAYFVRDDDEDIFPDASAEANAKAAVMELVSANTKEDDVFILGPEMQAISVSVTGLLPATSTMKTAVENQILSWFKSSVREGEDLEVEKLKGAIYQTYDSEAGERIESFTLYSPTVDQVVNTGYMAYPLYISVAV